MLDQWVATLPPQIDKFTKISGRYIFKNIKSLIEEHFSGVVIDIHWKHRVVHTSLFSCDVAFYIRTIHSLYQLVDDSQNRWIEKVLYEELTQKKYRYQTQVFAQDPLIKVKLGSSESVYDKSQLNWKHYVRNCERMLFRKLHINQIYL